MDLIDELTRWLTAYLVEAEFMKKKNRNRNTFLLVRLSIFVLLYFKTKKEFVNLHPFRYCLDLNSI